MSIGIFTDKKNKPSPEEIVVVIGKLLPLWKEIIDFLSENYQFTADERFYGINYGWANRFKKSGRTLISLFPENNFFTALTVLNPKEVDLALNEKIQEKIKEIIKKAKPYFEGRWLFIKVKSKKDISDIQKLLLIKAKPSKSRNFIKI